MVLPTVADEGTRFYYPDVKRFIGALEAAFAEWVTEAVEAFVTDVVVDHQAPLAAFLWQQFPETPAPPYDREQLKSLMRRYYLRSCHYYLSTLVLALSERQRFHFKNFYHPFVCDFARLVANPLAGIPALMSRETQLKDTGFRFRQVYRPTDAVIDSPREEEYPREIVDFLPDGAYSPYNWELFFHAPLLIANSLSRNQRFEEAMDWYHFIFNPIGVEPAVAGGSAMSRYWMTKPLFEITHPHYVQQRIDNILLMLAGDTSVPGFSAQLRQDLEAQVRDWRVHPFEPHRIAAYRIVAYQKTVVMKYLDNLIAWGDNLFRQDSMESINEATQLYVLAAEILGPRPRRVPPRVKPPLETFNELEATLDDFGNALVEVENLIPSLGSGGAGSVDPAPLPTLYFCLPTNEKMLGYWDTVADRLYKIRHCMNIEGVVRQLALFEPPIDPAALVKAVAAGLDVGAALADLNAPLPLYRFNLLVQKANEVCNDVKALGGALLGALEKKDAEALSLLRQGQELRLHAVVRAVRETQLAEAKENLEGSRKSKAVTEARRDYYRDIERLSSQEKLHFDKMKLAGERQEIAQGIKLAASIVSYLPGLTLGSSGFGGTPLLSFKIGGLELGQAAGLAADVMSFLSLIASNDAAMASSKGGYDRRWDDWKLQERLAGKELEQLDRQIAAAELRVAIAEKELANQDLQIESSKAVDAFLRSKYTSGELYQWQVGEVSAVYFQSYRLAYDLAKRAERCFRFELGVQDGNDTIQFGYWDSLKKGLLSGEKLQYDLRRLEAAYLERNRREFELTKHVSLALLDPLALVRLQETGRCFFRLPEEIFDLDYPGHYFRRIKSVSLTLPGVTGPYTTISCTLRLLKSSVRVNTANGEQGGYARNLDEDGVPTEDVRFVETVIPVRAIAASGAQNDSGVFELSFRDERYLPFEGAGAISKWALELFHDASQPDFGRSLRQFDYRTITDAVLHVKYTAREDAGPFKNGTIEHLRTYLGADKASLRLLDLRREMPTAWSRFLHPAGAENLLEWEMSPDLFLYRDAGKPLMIHTLRVLARCKDAGIYTVTLTPPTPAAPVTLKLPAVQGYGGLHFGQQEADPEIPVSLASPPAVWKLKMTRPGGAVLETDEVQDLMLVLGYRRG